MHAAIVLLIGVVACLIVGLSQEFLRRRAANLVEGQFPYLRLDNLTHGPMF